VIIVAGAKQGLEITASLLLNPGDVVWMENPGYLRARAVLAAWQASIVDVPVDGEGLSVTAGEALAPDARLVYLTPSHQYPLGVTMSLARRLAVLAWASRGAWVVEDDYDSEFCYNARPLASLQGLDTAGRVIYLGTFSKVLFPGLRLGYVIVPPDLVDLFTAARAMAGVHASLLEQAALADFIIDGHFARHIRRMRDLYAERQATLVGAVRRDLGSILTVAPADVGMHLVGWFADGVDDRAMAKRAAAQGVDTPPLSRYAHGGLDRAGVLLGYSHIDAVTIRSGAERLARAWAG